MSDIPQQETPSIGSEQIDDNLFERLGQTENRIRAEALRAIGRISQEVSEILDTGYLRKQTPIAEETLSPHPTDRVELTPSFIEGLYGDGGKKHGLLHSFLAALGLRRL